MASITATDLKQAIAHVNTKMQDAGADYRYRYRSNNGYHVVDAYKGDRGRGGWSLVGMGIPKECIGALYSDAFDRMADAYCDRLREAAREFITPDNLKSYEAVLSEARPIHYPGATIPSPEFIVAALNACADIPLDALQNTDPMLVRDLVMDHYQPRG